MQLQHPTPADPVIARFRKPVLRIVLWVLALVVVEWWFSMMYIASGMNLIATAYHIPSDEWTNVPLLQSGLFLGSMPAMTVKIVFLFVCWRIYVGWQNRKAQNVSESTPDPAESAVS